MDDADPKDVVPTSPAGATLVLVEKARALQRLLNSQTDKPLVPLKYTLYCWECDNCGKRHRTVPLWVDRSTNCTRCEKEFRLP